MEESTTGDTDETGSESVLESEPDPEPILAPTWKKALETRSARQPPKAKATSRVRSPVTNGEGQTIQEGSEVSGMGRMYYRVGRKNVD